MHHVAVMDLTKLKSTSPLRSRLSNVCDSGFLRMHTPSLSPHIYIYFQSFRFSSNLCHRIVPSSLFYFCLSNSSKLQYYLIHRLDVRGNAILCLVYHYYGKSRGDMVCCVFENEQWWGLNSFNAGSRNSRGVFDLTSYLHVMVFRAYDYDYDYEHQCTHPILSSTS